MNKKVIDLLVYFNDNSSQFVIDTLHDILINNASETTPNEIYNLIYDILPTSKYNEFMDYMKEEE